MGAKHIDEIIALAEARAAEVARAAAIARVQRPLNTREAATVLGKSTDTLRRWRCDGTGPKWRMVGKRAGYDLADLEQWLCGGAR